MRILIVNVNWIGDVLFSTFLIRCLRKKYPYAYISTLIPERVKEVLENNPYLDEIIIFNPDKERKLPYLDLKLIQNLKLRRFTHSLHLHRSLTRKFYTYLSGIKERTGYAEKMKGFLLTSKLISQRDKVHRAFYYFRLAEPLDIEDDGFGLDFFLKEEEVNKMRLFLENQGISRFYLFHIGANWPPKKWPIKYWANLIDLITQGHKVPIVITGSKKDENNALAISGLTLTKPFLLTGQTTIRELASLIKLSCLFLSSDTAPLHLAIALAVPVVGIFGPTSPKITGPFRPKNKSYIIRKDIGCKIPCYRKYCPLEYKCMKSITPAKVLEAIEEIMV